MTGRYGSFWLRMNVWVCRTVRSLRTRATPEHFWGDDSRRGGISSVHTFTFTWQITSMAWELILLAFFSQRGLNPVKPVYDPDQPDGRLNLTASAFNQLSHYTSSPGCRSYCYAELAVFFPTSGSAVLSNGPGGPGPRAPKPQGAPKQPMRYFFISWNKRN